MTTFNNWDFEYDLARGQETLSEIVEPLADVSAANAVLDHRAKTDAQKYLEHDNQRNMGSCSAHGWTSGHEKLIWIHTGRVMPLSRHWLYIKAQNRSGIRSDSGCSIAECAWIAKNVGIPLEKYQPYPRSYNRNINPEADEQAKHCKVKHITKLTTYEECVEFLRLIDTAICIGILWGGNMRNPGQRLLRYNPTGGGHALCYIQIDPKTREETYPDLTLKNSHWFEKWGIRGCVPTAREAVEQMLDHRMTRQFGGFIGMRGLKLSGPDFVSPFDDGGTGMI